MGQGVDWSSIVSVLGFVMALFGLCMMATFVLFVVGLIIFALILILMSLSTSVRGHPLGTGWESLIKNLLVGARIKQCPLIYIPMQEEVVVGNNQNGLMHSLYNNEKVILIIGNWLNRKIKA